MVSSPPSPSSPMKEQRRAPRFRHQLLVELHEKRGARKLVAVDVARHGLFLQTDDPPRERHLVQLTVHLPSGPIRAAGSVTRTLKGRGDAEDGVGIQFFALSDDAKERWDDFIFSVARTTPPKGTRLPDPATLRGPDPSSATSARAPSRAPSSSSHAPFASSSAPASSGSLVGATFLVKLKSVERLREFAATHLAAGGTVLFTPVLRQTGEVVTLIVVHPKTDEEFRLPGIIHKAHSDRPKRLEIHFHGINPAVLNAFTAYVESGNAPTIQPEAPLPPPPSLMADRELDLDVDVFDEDTLDTDDRFLREPGDVSAPPTPAPPMAPASGPASAVPLAGRAGPKPIAAEPPETMSAPDPGLKPSTFVVRCDACAAEPYAIDLGPVRGILGLIADHRAFIAPKSGRVVTAPQLVDADTRQLRLKAFLEGGGKLEGTVDVMTLLGAAALGDAPLGADGPLKHTRAVERLEHAALRLSHGDGAARSRVSCSSCKDGHLTVERVTT